MKQSKIIEAYQTIESLASLSFPKETEWALYKVRLALRPHFEFQVEEENKLREKYQDHVDEEGNLEREYIADFLKDTNELANLEIELKDYEKPTIKLVDGINFKTIEELEDFVTFEL